jgi:hypothetical protein
MKVGDQGIEYLEAGPDPVAQHHRHTGPVIHPDAQALTADGDVALLSRIGMHQNSFRVDGGYFCKT